MKQNDKNMLNDKKEKLSKMEKEPEMSEFNLDDHIHTIRKAHDIVSDKTLMNRIKRHMVKSKKSITSLSDLREKRDEMRGMSKDDKDEDDA